MKASLASNYNDRIQLRVGGRGSMGADPRRSSIASAEDDGHQPGRPSGMSLFKKQRKSIISLKKRHDLRINSSCTVEFV